MGCRSTLDCNGTASAGVLAQLAALQYTGQAVICTASAAALAGPGAASGGTCTDARLSSSAYGNASAPPMIGFSLAFTGVPNAALGALMARASVRAAWDAVLAVAPPPTVTLGLSADSFILEAASMPTQRRRRLATVAVSAPTFSLRLLLLAPGANAASASAFFAGSAASFGQAAVASASQQITAANLTALQTNFSLSLGATVQGPISGGVAFAVRTPAPALVEFTSTVVPGGGGGGDGGGGGGGGGGGAGGAIIVILLIVGGGGGFVLCRTRGHFFGCRCTAAATCCGKFPLKGAAFKGNREAADTLDVLRGAARGAAAAPLKTVPPNTSRRGSQLAFDTASVLVVVSPLNAAARAGAAGATATVGTAAAAAAAGAAGAAPAAGSQAAPASTGAAVGAAAPAPAPATAPAAASAPAHSRRPAGPRAPPAAATSIQKVFRGFRSRKTNSFDRLRRMAGRAALSAAPGSAALAAAQTLQLAAASASRTEVKVAQGAVVARFAANLSGRNGPRAPMSDLQAALMVQRVYKGLKVRQALRGWTKVVDSDGDVFFRNGATGSLEWSLPDVPFRPASPGAAGGREADNTETDSQGVVWNLDGPGGRRLKQGWRRDEDETDVWYVGPGGESAWVAPLQDAFETDGPGGRRLAAGWRRCEDDTDVWCEYPPHHALRRSAWARRFRAQLFPHLVPPHRVRRSPRATSSSCSHPVLPSSRRPLSLL